MLRRCSKLASPVGDDVGRKLVANFLGAKIARGIFLSAKYHLSHVASCCDTFL